MAQEHAPEDVKKTQKTTALFSKIKRGGLICLW